jgi:hypothetical protein
MSKPTWKPIQIRLGEIEPWGDNPKYSTKEDARRLIETEQEFGQPIPFCVSPYLEESKVNCYDGHQRLMAWKVTYGDGFVIHAMQSDRHLTEAERKRFVLRMHNAHGQWDWEHYLSGWDKTDLDAGWMNWETLKGWNFDALNLREKLNSDVEPVDPNEEWEGMPEFEMKTDKFRSVIVHFENQESIDEFARLINQTLTDKTRSIWYPEKQKADLKDMVFTQNEP